MKVMRPYWVAWGHGGWAGKAMGPYGADWDGNVTLWGGLGRRMGYWEGHVTPIACPIGSRDLPRTLWGGLGRIRWGEEGGGPRKVT